MHTQRLLVRFGTWTLMQSICSHRTDIVEDTGASLSPAVDVGQIEGSFLFGLGLWTSEKVVHHPHTGKLLTDDTWV